MLASVRPTSILIYWRQDAETPKETRWNSNVQEALEKVGHTIEVAFDPDGFRNASRNGSFDVVMMMMRIEEARALKEELSSSSSLLPLVHFPTRSEYAKAKKV